MTTTTISPVAAYQPQPSRYTQHQHLSVPSRVSSNGPLAVAYPLQATRFGNAQSINWLQPPGDTQWEPINGRDLFLMVYPEALVYNQKLTPETPWQQIKALFRNFMQFTP